METKAVEVGTVRQILERLQGEGVQIGESALRRWIKSGQIPAVFCGRRIYLHYQNVTAFLRGEESKPQEEAVAAPGIRRIC